MTRANRYECQSANTPVSRSAMGNHAFVARLLSEAFVGRLVDDRISTAFLCILEGPVDHVGVPPEGKLKVQNHGDANVFSTGHPLPRKRFAVSD